MSEDKKKDSLAKAVASFTTLSTKINEICGRGHIWDACGALVPLTSSKLWASKPQDKMIDMVLERPQISDYLTESSKWSLSAVNPVISSISPKLYEPKVSILSALETKTSLMAHDYGIPQITSVASQITTISDLLSSQSSFVKELIAPSTMMTDLQSLAIQTHQSFLEAGSISEWGLGVVDSASYLVDRQVDWTTHFCSTVYGEIPYTAIDTFDAFAPKVNIISILPKDLEDVMQRDRNISPEKALENSNTYRLSERGKMIINKVVKINRLCERLGQKPIFKYTGATTNAAATMGGTVCTTEESFGNIIDGLYMFFYENIEHIKKLATEEAVKNEEVFQCIFRIKHIRTDFRHDYEHGSKCDIRNKDSDIADCYNHYAGRPVLLSSTDYLKAQKNLYDEVDELEDYLVQILESKWN